MSKLLFPVFILFGYFAFGQISFYKQFSNNGYDYGEGITQMEDSSYLITGSSSSFFEGPAQAFILKLDSLGNFKWSKHFGGAESDGGKRIMYIENDGILVAGFTNSSGAGAYDFYLFKTDVSGTLLWEKTYGTESWDRVYDAALTRDSGVIMVGETLNTDDGEPDILLVKTDKNGNELWSQQIGNAGPDMIKCIARMNDSTFALGGKVFVTDSMMHKAYVCQMDENGLVWWQDTLGLPGNSQINATCTSLSEIAFVGETNYLNNEISAINHKCNFNGAPSMSYIEMNEEIDKLVGVAFYGSSNRLAVAMNYDNQYSYGGYDVDIKKYYPAMIYEDILGAVHSVEDVFVGQLIQTSDTGVIVVGSYGNIGIGGSNIYVLKLYPDSPNLNVNTTNLTFESLVNILPVAEDETTRIYPNPAQNFVIIESEIVSEALTISVTDFTGRLIHQEAFNSNVQLDVSALANGAYYISILDGQNVVTFKKMIISR